MNERARALEVLGRTLAEEDALVGKNLARQRALAWSRPNAVSARRSGRPASAWRTIASSSRNGSSPAPSWSAASRRSTGPSRSCSPPCANVTISNRARYGVATTTTPGSPTQEAQLQTAQRQANELRAASDTSRILAPVSGRVTEVKVSPGSVLRTGQPVLSIDDGRPASSRR